MTRGRRVVRFSYLILAVIIVSGLRAQEPQAKHAVGLPEDWTHHHIIFTANYLRAHPEIYQREPRALHEVYRRWARYSAPKSAVDLKTAAQAASNTDWTVQLGGGTTAFGTFPVKFQLNPELPPSCTTDFVIFAIDVAGSQGTGNNGQATLVGYNQLYTGPNGSGGICGQGGNGGPQYLYSYNTSTITNGVIRTSPVMSLDGTKIAFVESSATGSALHILRFGTTGNNGTNVVNPVIPGTGNNAVMTTFNYTTANNTHSSPWIDYSTDRLWVSANDGKLYEFTGVFNGTPAEVTTGSWPVKVTGAIQMSSPVYDSVTSNIFIGDSRGILHSINANTPTNTATLTIGTTGQPNPGILDAPIIDSNGNVYATTSNDTNGAVIVQATAAGLTQLARVTLGAGSTLGTNVNLYDGDFDNTFYNTGTSGHYLACGTGSNTIAPYRYRLTINSGVLTADPAPVQLSTSTTARCGPITEFFNANQNTPLGNDYFFWGVTNNCVGTKGCVMSLTNGITVTTAASVGGTSGVIVDNDSTQSQCSNVYFASQGGAITTRLATKVQQNGLD